MGPVNRCQMSNRQLEEILEEKRSQALADALGISKDEVEQWVIDDYPETSDDGLVYGHVVEISEDAPTDLIQKLGGTSVNIGPLQVD